MRWILGLLAIALSMGAGLPATAVEYFDTGVAGVTASGLVIGSYFDGTSSHGFIYDGVTYQQFDNPNAGASGTFVAATNRDGLIIGDYVNSQSHSVSYAYKNGNFVDLPFPPGADEIAYRGVNSSEIYAGVYSIPLTPQDGFVYDGSTFKTISLGTAGTNVNSIADNGNISGSYFDSISHSFVSFISDGSSYDSISAPAGTIDFGIRAINSSGDWVGNATDPSTGVEDFVYIDGSLSSLDSFFPSEANNITPLSINDDGYIGGYFYETGFPVYRGFVYHDGSLTILDFPTGIIPEPATWLLLMSGFFSIGLVCRHRPRAPY